MQMSINPLIRSSSLVICAIALAISGQASAATATTSMSVSATVVATCSLTTGAMAFGSYSGTAVSSSADLSITCTDGAPYTIALGAGSGTSATTSARTMVNSADTTSTLSYGLYQDSAFATNWGDTVGTDTLAGTGTGAVQTVSVYGEIPAAQLTSTTGSYADTVVATINY
jgi:spore coat protein U-like protein